MQSAEVMRGSLLLVLLPALALARDVRVTTEPELRAALNTALPGDVITLANGNYAVGSKLSCTVAGTAALPIVVRGEQPFGATLESNTVIAIGVSAPFWRFEDFAMRGVCAVDSSCEHAFQVTGQATDVVLRRLRLVDFNAQLKVNASAASDGGYDMPHRGLVEACELYDTRPRATSNPVTKLNIDTGDDFVVRDNVIRDFAKNGGNFVSYGSFMKSGGKRGVYERNLVLCRSGGQAMTDTRIGLSFGGGGTAPQFCSPAFSAAIPCSVEHEDGVMRNNIVANCSDVGVYLNRARNSSVLHNTLVGTNGRVAEDQELADLWVRLMRASILRLRSPGVAADPSRGLLSGWCSFSFGESVQPTCVDPGVSAHTQIRMFFTCSSTRAVA